MTEARFLIDSLGEASQNPRFEGCVLDVAGGAEHGLEAERIATARLVVRDSRALRRAQVRIDEGLLLDAAPEDRAAAALADLPTEEFEIIAAESDDPQKMERIRRQREEKKSPLASRKAETEAKHRRDRAMEAMQKRLDGRSASAGRPRGRRK